MFSQKDFALRLKLLRKKAGMTQHEIADVLKLERSTYAYYEIARTTPDLSAVVKICKLYGIKADWLLTGEPSDQDEEDLNNELSLLQLQQL